jgi:CspA family cold shock protein
VEQGTVKWFDNSRGYGRIRTNLGGEDSVFVHFSKIQMEGYKSLVQNEEVLFEIEQTEKGFQAINVVPKRLAQAATK